MNPDYLPAVVPPIAVVLDANAMWHKWGLRGRFWDELQNFVERGRIALYVPEVVVQEVVRGRRHDANDLVTELAKDHKLDRLGLLGFGLPTTRRGLMERVQGLVANYDTELRVRLEQLGAEVVPIPGVSHEDVLARAMEGRRPFDQDGRVGYRDVLVWHSVLDVAGYGHAGLVFVTCNTKDFCITGAPSSLLPELRRELDVSRDVVEAVVATKVDDIGACVAELEKSLDVKEAPPAVSQPSKEDVLAILDVCIEVIVGARQPPNAGRWGSDLPDLSDVGFLSMLDDPVDVVEIDLDRETLDCVPDDEDWAEFTATVRAAVILDGFALKSDVYVEDRIQFYVLDWDWNDHVMHVQERHQAVLTFRLRYDDDGGVIEECWLDDAEEVA